MDKKINPLDDPSEFGLEVPKRKLNNDIDDDTESLPEGIEDTEDYWADDEPVDIDVDTDSE